MKISICLTTYKKVDILKKTLEDLINKSTASYELVISDDCSGHEMNEYLHEVSKIFTGSKIYINPINEGCSNSLGMSFGIAGGDYLIHLDPDITLEPMGWYWRMANFLEEHPEVGIVAPDYPMHHLRLHRPDYDEVDYCMGGVWAMRKEVVKEMDDYLGDGVWDRGLSLGQVEIDMCYRVRMLGYRVAMLKELNWTHLDPNPNWQGHKGVIEFLSKWNRYFLGFFNYKSPAMLTWDEFPLNKLLRHQIFCNLHLNDNPDHIVVQHHNCAIIKELRAPNSCRDDELCKLVEQNKIFRGTDRFENIPEDLWRGKVKWNFNVEKQLEERRCIRQEIE